MVKTGRVFTVAAAALQLGCHPETLRRAIRRKELLATRDPLSSGFNHAYVITAVDLGSFIEKRRLG